MRALAALMMLTLAACGMPVEASVVADNQVVENAVAERVSGDAVDVAQVATVISDFEKYVGVLTVDYTIEITSESINDRVKNFMAIAEGRAISGVTLNGKEIILRMVDIFQEPTSIVAKTPLFHELMHVYLRQVGAAGNSDHSNILWQSVRTYEETHLRN